MSERFGYARIVLQVLDAKPWDGSRARVGYMPTPSPPPEDRRKRPSRARALGSSIGTQVDIPVEVLAALKKNHDKT